MALKIFSRSRRSIDSHELTHLKTKSGNEETKISVRVDQNWQRKNSPGAQKKTVFGPAGWFHSADFVIAPSILKTLWIYTETEEEFVVRFSIWLLWRVWEMKILN